LPIEKIELPPRIEQTVKEDGTVEEKRIPQWEIKATGKEVQELRGAFKDTAPQMMHDTWKEWKAIGEAKITRPDGSTDVVRADHEPMYRQQPGFCVHATRPTFTMSGWGRMKAYGIVRQRIKWMSDGKLTETVYADGRKESVLEESNGNNHR
jgi:hypothetical protein